MTKILITPGLHEQLYPKEIRDILDRIVASDPMMARHRCECPDCECKFNVDPAYGNVCKWCERGEHREEK